jgi:hypothetical protein
MRLSLWFAQVILFFAAMTPSVHAHESWSCRFIVDRDGSLQELSALIEHHSGSQIASLVTEHIAQLTDAAIQTGTRKLPLVAIGPNTMEYLLQVLARVQLKQASKATWVTPAEEGLEKLDRFSKKYRPIAQEALRAIRKLGIERLTAIDRAIDEAVKSYLLNIRKRLHRDESIAAKELYQISLVLALAESEYGWVEKLIPGERSRSDQKFLRRIHQFENSTPEQVAEWIVSPPLFSPGAQSIGVPWPSSATMQMVNGLGFLFSRIIGVVPGEMGADGLVRLPVEFGVHDGNHLAYDNSAVLEADEWSSLSWLQSVDHAVYASKRFLSAYRDVRALFRSERDLNILDGFFLEFAETKAVRAEFANEARSIAEVFQNAFEIVDELYGETILADFNDENAMRFHSGKSITQLDLDRVRHQVQAHLSQK